MPSGQCRAQLGGFSTFISELAALLGRELTSDERQRARDHYDNEGITLESMSALLRRGRCQFGKEGRRGEVTAVAWQSAEAPSDPDWPRCPTCAGEGLVGAAMCTRCGAAGFLLTPANSRH